MRLVSRVFQAHGGLDRWHSKHGFSAHVSISGSLLPPPQVRHPSGAPYVASSTYQLPTSPKGHPTLRELVVENDTKTPYLRMFKSNDLTQYGVYTPGRTERRSMSHQLLESLDNPIEVLALRRPGQVLRVLEGVFLIGAMIWNAIVGPFLLDQPEILVREEQTTGHKGVEHLLNIAVPTAIEPLTPQRTLYPRDDGLVGRNVYELKHLYPGLLVDLASAFTSFDGIVVPTLRRVRPLEANSDSPASPLLDIEIFDVQFT